MQKYIAQLLQQIQLKVDSYINEQCNKIIIDTTEKINEELAKLNNPIVQNNPESIKGYIANYVKDHNIGQKPIV